MIDHSEYRGIFFWQEKWPDREAEYNKLYRRSRNMDS
jgi:hypothetical protein